MRRFGSAGPSVRAAIESGSDARSPPDALSRGRHVQHPPRVPRDPAPLDLGGPADQRRLRLRHDAAQDASRARARPASPSPGTARSGRAATRITPTTRPTARRWRRPRRPDPRDPRASSTAYRIPVLELPGYEADDVIGTLAQQGRGGGFDVVIVTADKDMLQLVWARASASSTRARRSSSTSPAWPSSSACRPGQVADVLALMGDASDNIPGVPGVGPGHGQEVDLRSTAASPRFSSAPARSRARSARACASTARTRCSRAAWPRSRRTCPIPFDPEALRRSEPGLREASRSSSSSLEFHSLAAEIQGEAAAAPSSTSRALAAGRAVLAIVGESGRRRAPDAAATEALLAVSPTDRTSDRRGARRRRSPPGGPRLERRGAPRFAIGRREAARRAPRASRRRGPRATSSTSASPSTSSSSGRRRAPSSSRWPSSASASSSDRGQGGRRLRRARSPDAYAIASADRWLAERVLGGGRTRAAARGGARGAARRSRRSTGRSSAR